MPQPTDPRPRLRLSLRGWAAVTAGLVILCATALLAIGFLVFVLPVLVLGSLLYFFLPRRRPPSNVLEGDFRVVDQPRQAPGDACPECGHPMHCVDKSTMSGDDMRTLRCQACGHEEIVNYGMATWKAMSGKFDD